VLIIDRLNLCYYQIDNRNTNVVAFGMIPIIEKRRTDLIELCRRFSVKRLELFGSAVSGSFDPALSDLDFLVEFEPSTPTEHATRYFGLFYAIRDLFGRKVDLIEIRAIRNPYFKEKVEASKIQLYGA